MKDRNTLLLIKRKGKIIRNCFCNYFNAGANQPDFNSRRIKAAALHCINYLEPRLEFWQQYKPFYSRGKRKRARFSLVDREKHDLTIHNVLLDLVHIEMLQYQGDHWKVIEKAKKIISILKEIPGIDSHNYHIILSDLYSIIGNCYMNLNLLTEALEFHELDKTNGIENNIKDAISRSMDYIGLIYSIKNEYRKAIRVWNSKIKYAVSNVELSWLYHEIGRCFFNLGDFENTLKFAKHALEKANLGMDETWQLNANILMAKAYSSLKMTSESTEIYMKALEISKILKLVGVEEELNKLIEENLLRPRGSASKCTESLKMVSKFKPDLKPIFSESSEALPEFQDKLQISVKHDHPSIFLKKDNFKLSNCSIKISEDVEHVQSG